MWSVGVILYTLVMGKVPFDGNFDKEVFNSIINKPMIFKEQGRRSTELMDLMKRLLFKDPISRLSAMEAINHRLIIVRGKDPFIYDKTKEVLVQFKNY